MYFRDIQLAIKVNVYGHQKQILSKFGYSLTQWELLNTAKIISVY